MKKFIKQLKNKMNLKSLISRSLVLVIMCLVFFAPLNSYAENLTNKINFTDVKEGSWYYSNLSTLCNLGIINGFTDGTFRGDDTLTRAQYLKMLVMILDKTFDPNTSNDIKKDNSWFAPYLTKAIRTGIVKEDKDMAYYNEPITREEVAFYTDKAYNYAKENQMLLEENQGEVNLFKDIEDSDDKYIQSVIRLSRLQLLNGYPDGTFKPKGILTRAESTSVCCKFLDMLKKD